VTVRNSRLSVARLLCQPFTKTDLARHGFRCSCPAVWNSLPRTAMLEGSSTSVFRSRLKTHWCGSYQTVTTWPVIPPPLKLQPMAW